MKDTQDSKSNTQDTVNFGEGVLYTEEFLQEWWNLPSQMQQIVQKMVDLFITDPDHRSFEVCRLQGSHLYECSLRGKFLYHLWFELQGNRIILVRVGKNVDETSTAMAINALRVARSTAIHRTESAEAPDSAQPQKSSQEDFIVASAEKAMTAFLESEPHYENLYRRLVDM